MPGRRMPDGGEGEEDVDWLAEPDNPDEWRDNSEENEDVELTAYDDHEHEPEEEDDDDDED